MIMTSGCATAVLVEQGTGQFQGAIVAHVSFDSSPLHPLPNNYLPTESGVSGREPALRVMAVLARPTKISSE